MADNRANFAYEKIRHMLVYGGLRPGDRVRERELAERLGISRSPVREAIRRLIAQGFIEQQPRHPARVRVLSRRDVQQLGELRATLERAAVAAAARSATDEQLQSLRDICEQYRQLARDATAWQRQSDTDHFFERHRRIDMAFHAGLHEASNNPWLIRVTSELALQAQLCSQFQAESYTILQPIGPKLTRAFRKHYRVFLLVARRDAEGAARAAAQFIEWANEDLLRRYDRAAQTNRSAI